MAPYIMVIMQVILQTPKMITDNPSDEDNEHPNLASVRNFFLDFSKKVLERFHHKELKSDDQITKSKFATWNNKDSSTMELNLERQMKAWKDNPNWEDRLPHINVTIPKGSLSNLNLTIDVGLPPDAIYNIVTDPDNKRVFKNIKEVISRKVLVDEGLRQVVEVEQAAIWRFLWLSGTISVHVLVDQNRQDYTMKFKQIKSGFMEKFEGSWKVEPLLVDKDLCYPFEPKSMSEYVSCTRGKGRIGSKLRLEQLIQPSVVPPPPFSWYLRGITTKTTEMMINDLVAEAARIRKAGNFDEPEEKCGESETQAVGYDIKERWALRRKNARNSRKRLFF
ncbi:hypothetical protein CASFOL_003741 [Castilleja foliolosa]|uniref:DUF220 domain-containing protein n=1 Tax=Castilleja foliolosa TaxID=1961234 RepID=A0ABD3EI21_9LAMI